MGLDRNEAPKLRQDDAPFQKASHQRTNPQMDDQLGGDQDRKGDQEARMYFYVAKKRKPVGATRKWVGGGKSANGSHAMAVMTMMRRYKSSR